MCENFYYWSPAEAKQTEVDFLLEKQGGYLALEAKSQNHITPEHFKGLRAIKELKNIKRRMLIYAGEKALRTDDGIDVLPVPEFLKRLEQGTFWN